MATTDRTRAREIWVHEVVAEGSKTFRVTAFVRYPFDDMFTNVMHPVAFETRSAAMDFAAKVKNRGSVDLSIWGHG